MNSKEDALLLYDMLLDAGFTVRAGDDSYRPDYEVIDRETGELVMTGCISATEIIGAAGLEVNRGFGNVDPSDLAELFEQHEQSSPALPE